METGVGTVGVVCRLRCGRGVQVEIGVGTVGEVTVLRWRLVLKLWKRC